MNKQQECLGLLWYVFCQRPITGSLVNVIKQVWFISNLQSIQGDSSFLHGIRRKCIYDRLGFEVRRSDIVGSKIDSPHYVSSCRKEFMLDLNTLG